MFDWITDLVSGNPWTYVVVAGVAAGDVLLPLLGYLGGEQFRHSLWLPLLIGCCVALLVALGVEVARRVARRRGHDLLGGSM